MRIMNGTDWARAALAAGSVLIACAACLFGQAPSGPATGGLDARIAETTKAVLADPLDSAAQSRLKSLRDEQRRHRGDCYDQLVRGLEAYLQGDRSTVVKALTAAKASGRVMSLTRQLARSIDELIAESRGGRPVANRPKVCTECGNTGVTDCLAGIGCMGSGTMRCATCQGKGVAKIPVPNSPNVFITTSCRVCRGSGMVTCTFCKGTGRAPCKRCASKPKSLPLSAPSQAFATAVKKIIAMARHLNNGGIDLYTSRALAPSPKQPAP